MNKINLLLALVVCTSAWTQSKIEGHIYDEATNTPLPYCSIKIYGSKEDYTITNEDGKFAIGQEFANDSLEIRHIGFKPKKEALSYFKSESRLYLETDVSALDEVVLTAGEDKEYPYRLLAQVVEKYRAKNSITHSKAFLKLSSSARNIPIEQIEGFYNSDQSLSGGILDLKVKSGRFGQNKKFAFYSLDNTKILSDFELFGTTGQLLPNYPGNMNYEAISRKYKVRIDPCTSCNEQDVAIAFFPKRPNGRLFYGKLIVDHARLIVKRIELGVKEPNITDLASINENIELIPIEMQLDIAFDPMDLDKIQYLNLTLRMDYRFDGISEIIDSRTFLYAYDYDFTFEAPYFTKELTFNNDYDKIIALQASDHFWESNYQFPKSFKDNRSMNFMKKHGYLINYNSYIPLSDLMYAKPSVLSWHKDYRLQWEHLTNFTPVKEEEVGRKNSRGKRDVTVGQSFDSPVAAHIQSTSVKNSTGLNITYVVDSYFDGEGKNKTESRTLLDLTASQFNNDGSRNRLAYINIIFDIYEVYRQLASSRITDSMNSDEAKAIFDEIYQGAAIEVKKMQKETQRGADQEALQLWNRRINARLGVDNISLNR
ncbi:carboxypeptidase-like regulatory domain-containing protein [Flagellimonas algicola]|uniref:Carboxypeptidase-like regulatory domain-containing protein n=1 Tax=Flagellimonas algicola TaxID=2583815 RepID=A0ABY2WPZ5_9FLAO|nr:carboxypeptidase-like regulatory domain-containing protein [Allomuricauda algicola]TMU57061.1 carboxypeptidase-like regulatory domain-containing protein [Allomuricauda algicola]